MKGKPEREVGGAGQLDLLARAAPVVAVVVPAPPTTRTPPRGTAVSPTPPIPGPAAPRVFTVLELVRAARLTLESNFKGVLVQGEISGARPSPQGHLYFTLKDSEAQIPCVMFASDLARLKFKPDNGLQVECRGRLTIFEGQGKFQLTVSDLKPAGAGALALAFEQLKQRLAAEGLFAESRKRPLPFLPRRIGVVSSPTGAVIRDIIKVAHRRYPVRILLSPTPVQGEGVAAQIIRALELVVTMPEVDVVILARGGGSLEDLWAFNEESLARAIARCPVPVISAIGHETDFTIADFVADRRAPTPSAAAEMVVPEMGALRESLFTTHRRLCNGADGRLQRSRRALDDMRARFADPRRLLRQYQQKVDDLLERTQRATRGALRERRRKLHDVTARLQAAHPSKRIAADRRALGELGARLHAAAGPLLVPRRRAISSLQATLDALSPLKVLERGYSLTRGADGTLIRRAADVKEGDRVTVTVATGQFGAQVVGTDPSSDAPAKKKKKGAGAP